MTRMTTIRRASFAGAICVSLWAAAAGAAAQTAGRCDAYASPQGGGNGKSEASPYRIEAFWRDAAPGKTLCLLDGRYADQGQTIDPPPSPNGEGGKPITVRALHDGKVLIDGQGKRLPIRLFRKDWIVVEGVNACCSSATVVGLDHSNHNVLRRVAAWDAHDGNDNIFGIHNGEHNLLEDVAGWGIARKIFESSQHGDYTTIRRAWGRWEGSHVIGPKSVYTLAYNNYNITVESSIGTWSGEKVQESYTLMDYSGKPWEGKGGGVHQNHDVDQPYAVFAVDNEKDDKNAHARLLGSIAYVTSADTFKAPQVVFVTNIDSVEIANTMAYVEPGSYPSVKAFGLFGLMPSSSLVARNITGIGGAGNTIRPAWKTENVLEGRDMSVYPAGENPFNATRGANLCRGYVDGALTNDPLWPWPMNQRILEATAASGRQPVDVTATIEKMLGPIPRGCRANPSE